MRRRLLFIGASALYGVSLTSAANVTKHEAGRCSMRGQCGKESFFTPELPCPYNGLASDPSTKNREKLVSICGSKWSSGALCCDESQMDALSDNLKRADSFIASCPACRENFYNLFCTFTCSPDQSLFLNVTQTTKTNTDEQAVTEVDNLWDKEYKKKLYDSCKDVKFGPTNGRALDLLGGGAQNYSEFLDFLGEKKLIGSPFQINFPEPDGREKDGMKAVSPVARACNDPDEKYKCACVDCPVSCPELSKLEEEQYCYVGLLPCLSFAAVLIYSGFLAMLITALVGHVAYRKHAKRQNERLRLLQDADASDDSDDEHERQIVHNAGLLDKPRRSYFLNTIFDRAFARLGGACARYPLTTIGSSLFVVFLLSLGWINFEVERDPVRLWVSPSSPAAQEKAYFDEKFGPFFRAEQAFLVNDTSSDDGTSPVMSYETLKWWFDVEAEIRNLPFFGLELNDVCFNPTGKACVVQSVTGYFGGDFSQLDKDNWQKQVRDCADTPTDCLPPFDLPLSKDLLFGGYNQSQESVLDASTLIITWVVANYPQGSAEEAKAALWESGLRLILTQTQAQADYRGLRLSYSTESSLEEELNKSANTDAKIVVVSYLIMFIYASFALGSASLSIKKLTNNPVSVLIHSKFTLGISGIVIVLLSVSASVGLFSAAGIKVTLIIAEVIPFLVLAVGVDNIFLIVHEFERVNRAYPEEEIDSRIAKALGRMGPSILLSASTETVAFVLGVFVGMPAVRNFAAYAAGAVFINALLQVTMFVAVLALDQKRRESNRVDCFPFIKLSPQAHSLRGHRYDPADDEHDDKYEGPLQRFIRSHYAPFLLNRKVKVAVVAVFLGFCAAGVALIPTVQLGLDQRLAIPDGSYLIDYFNDLYAYLNTGPPVYFVARDVDASHYSAQQTLCARFTTCHQYSLTNVLEQESKRSDISYVTGSAANWFDDFMFWLRPDLDCCFDVNGERCFANREDAWNITLAGMPEDGEFLDLLSQYVESPSDATCPLGGKAPYSQAIAFGSDGVEASHFRVSHTPLRSEEDLIQSYRSARRIASDVSEKQNIDVFPYSKHYIFFDQYISIVNLTVALLGTALLLILFLSSVLLGSLATGLITTMTVVLILVDIAGTMSLSGVSLNALSLVNLIICVGIGVEFCAHIARAFTFPSRPLLDAARARFRGRDARVAAALENVAASVFSGIFCTKLVGVCVLAFTHSKIFEVYYFRIWLALVLWAGAHALVFLPVVLSLGGGSEGYLDSDSEGALNGDLSSRRYRALLADDDDSDDGEYDDDYY